MSQEGRDQKSALERYHVVQIGASAWVVVDNENPCREAVGGEHHKEANADFVAANLNAQQRHVAEAALDHRAIGGKEQP